MKKVILLFVFLMGAMVSFGQSAEKVRQLELKEMDHLKKIISFTNENVVLNKNQEVKLERLFSQKAKEIVLLRGQGLSKQDYVEQYNNVVEKYQVKIKQLLTPAQRVEYERNHKKQMKLMKG